MSGHELACWQCGEVHPGSRLVTTPDGRQMGNYSVEWQLYCEAKWVLKNKRSTRTRQAYLAVVAEKRGAGSAQALREEMIVQYRWKEAQKK